MHAFLRSAAGTLRKDLTIWRRDRPVLAVGVIAPLGLLLIMALFFGAGGRPDAAPVVLVSEGQGPVAARLAETFRSIRSQVSPWWKLLPPNPRLFASEEVPGMAVIPADFDQSLTLKFYLHNWNSDLDQNYRYRLAYTLGTLEAGFPENRGIRVVRRETLSRDVTWAAYMAGTTLAYAAMLAAILFGGVAAARETERGTARFVGSTPASPWALALGRTLAAAAGASISALVAWAFAALLWKVRVSGPASSLVAVLFLEALAFAGLGVFLGGLLRRQHLLMLPTGLIALPLWFLSGGIGPVALFPQTLQTLARWLPTTYAFGTVSQLVLFGSAGDFGLTLAVLAGTAIVTFGLAGVVTARPS
ncbi:MAG: ABC transporter permease [Bacillota bacterium]|nr:ABC transporter permease [Bacillota bacterium]